MERPPITSFYRLQFGGDMTFDKAAERVGYLDELGISHLYASPIFRATSGSAHGYDVTDPNTLSPDLGGEEGFARLSSALGEAGLGLMLDIVPNHMSASPENPWLRDVMRNGRQSGHADVFDIDWKKGDGRIVLPVLGAPLDEVLSAGELSVDRSGPETVLRYYEKAFPLAPGTEDMAAREAVREQNYRLVHWRDLSALNYRRFFDITDLIGVRQEDEAVFAKTHGLVRRLIEEGHVQALRVDHIDGLRDPAQYLDRLAYLFPSEDPAPIYVEKILEGGEHVPAEWNCRGETGYWFLGRADKLFIDPVAQEPFEAAAPAGDGDLHELVDQSKNEILGQSFAHEFQSLAASIGYPAEDLQRLARNFSVYRTYLSPRSEAIVNDRERRLLGGFAKQADAEDLLPVLGDEKREAALRFQQMTGPVMAKSLEDTAFYRDVRLLALNEVGADFEAFTESPAVFHEEVAERHRRFPLAMNGLSTHDTKRSEDARARLLALTYHSDEWPDWSASFRHAVGAPNGRVAHHLLQAAIAAWDGEDLPERLKRYLLKAEREAKLDTAWTDQNADYEAALEQVVDRALGEEAGALVGRIVAAIEPDAERIGIARTVIKLTVPGIPDTYQGTEIIYRRLVDPDNRGTPRFADTTELTAADRTKEEITCALLGLRREHPRLFLEGTYTPKSTGCGVLAFERSLGPQRLCVTIALRPKVRLEELPGEPVVDHPAARVALVQVSS